LRRYIKAGVINTPSCTVTGTGVGTAGAIAAGAEAKFVVTARDRYRHAISEGRRGLHSSTFCTNLSRLGH